MPEFRLVKSPVSDKTGQQVVGKYWRHKEHGDVTTNDPVAIAKDLWSANYRHRRDGDNKYWDEYQKAEKSWQECTAPIFRYDLQQASNFLGILRWKTIDSVQGGEEFAEEKAHEMFEAAKNLAYIKSRSRVIAYEKVKI